MTSKKVAAVTGKIANYRGRLVLELLLALTVLYGVSTYLQRGMLQGRAPHIAATGVKGQSLSLSAANRQATLVYFFADWCGACNLTSPAISAIAEDHPVLAIAVDSGDDSQISAFLNQRGYSFDALNDNGQLAQQFGVSGLPAIFLVDRHGQVQFVTRGVSSEIGLRLRLLLTEQLY